MKDLTKISVQNILQGKSTKNGKLLEAIEVKVTTMSFQNTPEGIPTIEVAAVRPQTNDESGFVKIMETAAGLAALGSGNRFVNFTVDGISCESMRVTLTICKFLEILCNHLGATDANHNAQSARY